jgi:hypothetical protein
MATKSGHRVSRKDHAVAVDADARTEGSIGNAEGLSNDVLGRLAVIRHNDMQVADPGCPVGKGPAYEDL